MLDFSCAVYSQARGMFCPAMFLMGLGACLIVYAISYISLYRWIHSRGLNSVDVEDASIRVVSAVHAMWLALPFNYSLLFDHLENPFLSHYSCSTFIISASLGYFLFDTVALLHWCHAKGRSWKSELPMLLHHVFAAGGEYFTLTGEVGGFLVAVLMLSEYTTPLLHLLYVLEKAKCLGNNVMTKCLCGLFVFQWIVFRIGVSLSFIVYNWVHLDALLELSIHNQILLYSVTIFFNLINLFWFMKILRKGERMLKKARGGKKTQ